MSSSPSPRGPAPAWSRAATSPGGSWPPASSPTPGARPGPRRSSGAVMPDSGRTRIVCHSSIQVRPISRVGAPSARAANAGTLPPSRKARAAGGRSGAGAARADRPGGCPPRSRRRRARRRATRVVGQAAGGGDRAAGVPDVEGPGARSVSGRRAVMVMVSPVVKWPGLVEPAPCGRPRARRGTAPVGEEGGVGAITWAGGRRCARRPRIVRCAGPACGRRGRSPRPRRG